MAYTLWQTTHTQKKTFFNLRMVKNDQPLQRGKAASTAPSAEHKVPRHHLQCPQSCVQENHPPPGCFSHQSSLAKVNLMVNFLALGVGPRNTQENNRRPGSQSSGERTNDILLSPVYTNYCWECWISEEGSPAVCICSPHLPFHLPSSPSPLHSGFHSNKNLLAPLALSTEVLIQRRCQQLRGELQPEIWIPKESLIS